MATKRSTHMLTEENIERMEGLTNLAAHSVLEESVKTIYEDLEEDGYERGEILEYLNLIVEGACFPK